MAEKESEKQQSPSAHFDQQASEKQKSQVAMFGPSQPSCKSAQLEPQQPAGFYQNMTTKSKLILPTALWLLIIVAGACFLGLLSSLSKTLSTLDTLVEIEQQKEHEANLRHQAHHAKAQKLDSELSDAWMTNEPARYKLTKDVGPVNAMMEEVMRALGEPAGEMTPVSGSIIVTSSGPNFQSAPSQAEFEAQGMVDSLVKQMFDSSKGHKEIEAAGQQAPLITANIDKININFKESKSKSEPTKGQRVEQSIDGLIDLLMHSSNGLPASGPDSGAILMPLITPPMRHPQKPFDQMAEPLGPMRASMAHHQGAFFGRGPPAHLHAHRHAHPHHRHQQQQQMEAERMLLGSEEARMRPDLMLMVPEAPMFGRPTASQSPETVVIALDDPHGQQSPPYELLAPEHRHAHPHRPPMDAGQALLEADVANSLAQTLLQALDPRGANLEPPHGNKGPVDSVVFINGEPLIGEQEAKRAQNLKKEPNRNQVSDFFNLFFGPPPNSKLVVAQPQIVGPSFDSLVPPKAKQNSEQQTKQELNNLRQQTTSAPLTEERREPSLEARDEGAAAPQHREQNSHEEAATKKKEEQFNVNVDDLLNFFTLPQMNSQSQPQRVGGQEQTSAELKLVSETPTTTTKTATNSPTTVQETQSSLEMEPKEPASTTESSVTETSTTPADDEQEIKKGSLPMSELAQAFFDSGTNWIKNKLFPGSKTQAEEPAQDEVLENTVAPASFDIPAAESVTETSPPSNLVLENFVSQATPDFETTTASLKSTPTADSLSPSQSLEIPKAETKSLVFSHSVGEASTTPTSQTTKQSINPEPTLAKSEQITTTVAPITVPTVASSIGVQPTTTVEPETKASNSTSDPTVSPASMKAFFKKADDFIEKGLATFKRFL